MVRPFLQVFFLFLALSNCGFTHEHNSSRAGPSSRKVVAETSQSSKCVCVPIYQCQDGNIITDGSGMLDVRKKTTPKTYKGNKLDERGCGEYEVCCNAPSDGNPVHPYHHRCGVRQPNGINSRILSTRNKSEAQFGEWPWQAMILRKTGEALNYVCGAVLIDDLFLLTVAHCVYAFVQSNKHTKLFARLGEWDTMKETEFLAFQDREIVRITIHPEFRNSSLWNDVAVLNLREPVTYSPNVDTICLPRPNEQFLNNECVVTGWGKNAYDGGSYSNILKVVDVPVVEHSTCQNILRTTRLGAFFQLHHSFLCAGGEKGKDSCKGDGGGPLSCYRNDGTYAVAGLVSWGIDCGQNGIPGVYVGVVEFVDWIAKITGRPLKSYWPAES